jgi:ribosomal protein S27AE
MYETKRKVYYRIAITTRHDLRRGCVNCGHREFIVLERGKRDAFGTKTGVDVEACERCNQTRHV